jgi:hypothetical protein
MRYSRVYSKSNRDGSRTVVRYGPAASFARLFVDAFCGVIAAGLIIVGSGIHSPLAQKWIVWCFLVGVPLLTWMDRRAARHR